MINGKTYYQILGVLEDAEDIVIRAAYKVLAQKYHPDKWSGSKEEATQRMSEINQAYGTLSDTQKRSEYDRESTSQTFTFKDNGENDSGSDPLLNDDWKVALGYYPELKYLLADLLEISLSLGNTFLFKILETKSYEDAEQIAFNIKNQYLEKYFGSNENIKRFAVYLIKNREKLAAAELNKVMTVLPGTRRHQQIIANIAEKYLKSDSCYRRPHIHVLDEYISISKKEITEYAMNYIQSSNSLRKGWYEGLLLDALGIKTSGITNRTIYVGKKQIIFKSLEECENFVRNIAKEIINLDYSE